MNEKPGIFQCMLDVVGGLFTVIGAWVIIGVIMYGIAWLLGL